MDNLITEAKAWLDGTFSHVRHAAAWLVGGAQVLGNDLNTLEANNPLVARAVALAEAEGKKLGLPEDQIATDANDLLATAKAIATMQDTGTPVPAAASVTEPENGAAPAPEGTLAVGGEPPAAAPSVS